MQAQNGYTGPELWHNAVAQFYDIPHISAKGVLYDQYFERPDRVLSDNYFGSHLINKDGHDLMADVVISYFMSQICSGWSSMLGLSYSATQLTLSGESGSGAGAAPVPFAGLGLRPNQEPDQNEHDNQDTLGKTDPALEVPPMRLNNLPSEMSKFREVEPFCVSAADLVHPLPESLLYGSGFSMHVPASNSAKEDRFYWYAERPTSRLRIPLRIGAGDVGVYFMQQPMDKPAATAKCWVDDNVGGAKALKGNADTEEPIAT